MRYIGGIDPGLTGALAVLDFEEFKLHLWDTPVVQVKVGDKIRERCDIEAFRKALSTFPLDLCVVERVQSTPNDGHVGAFTFGKVTGITLGLIIGMCLPLDEITPAKWKMQMRVPANKEQARYRASELFPKCADAWRRQMDHGRSEAAIIALHGAIPHDLLPTSPFTLGSLNGSPATKGKR